MYVIDKANVNRETEAMPSSPTVSSEYERYLIADSEHVDRLLECNIRQLGLLIDDLSPGLGDWKTLATRLGFHDVDVRRIKATMRDYGDGQVVPGEEVLKLWSQTESAYRYSTIRILKQVLDGMKRDDVIRQLDYMRLSKLILYRFQHFRMMCLSKVA